MRSPWVIAIALAACSQARGAQLGEPYAMNISKAEARSTLIEFVENLHLAQTPIQLGAADANVTEREGVARLVRSYRIAARKAALPLKDAPYLPILAGELVGRLYPVMYDEAYARNLKEKFDAIGYETIFDLFMDGLVKGQLPEDPGIRAAAKRIGRCLPKRVIAGKSDACRLDPSDQLDEPGTFKKGWVKAACVLRLPFPSHCSTRKVIYDAAKRHLIAFKKDPKFRELVETEFRKQFPQAFRDGFLQEIATRMRGFPAVIGAKFGGERDPLWEEETPLVDSDAMDADGGQGRFTMREFARGLRADVEAAALLAASSDAGARSLAAPLFYGAANRILLLTGGSETTWDGSRFVLADSAPVDPDDPKKLPVFATNAFGGWSGLWKGEGPGFSPWDWAAYDPSQWLRVFPSEFVFGPRGQPSAAPGVEIFETLDDLAELLVASAAFLRETRPGSGVLARYFADPGDAAAMERLLDPASPILFPREGRRLAVGVIAAILQNLAVPASGHLELVPPGTPGAELGMIFHDRLGLTSRENGATVRGVGRVLIVADYLERTLEGDPDLPAELAAKLPQLARAVQAGAVWLGAKGQEMDGGFRDRLGEPLTGGRSLANSVSSLRAMTAAFDASQTLLLQLRIRQGWAFLDARLWAPTGSARSIEGSDEPAPPSELWALLSLWEKTRRSAVFPALAGEVDWNAWTARFDQLRARLRAQFLTLQGPEPL